MLGGKGGDFMQGEKRTFHTIDLVLVGALISVCTVVLAVFFFYTESSGDVAFRCVMNRNTGEPMSIVGSLVVYGFIGSIAYGLFTSALCVVVVEPIVHIYQIIKKIDTPRRDPPPGFNLGFTASFTLGAAVFLVIGISLCFGIRTF